MFNNVHLILQATKINTIYDISKFPISSPSSLKFFLNPSIILSSCQQTNLVKTFWPTGNIFLKIYTIRESSQHPLKIQNTDRHILEKQITPVILDIEEQPKDQNYVHHADEDDHHHACVHCHLIIFSD